MNKKIALALKIISAVIVLLAFVALCIWLIPLVASLKEPENQENFRELIDSLGALGVLLMLALQIVQIIVAIIPGEPVEVLMGMMYGTFGGLVLTLTGIVIGQTLVFFMVKLFGMKFASRFVDVKKFSELSFLKRPEHRDGLIFLLFFIPGTPKDILTYFAPFTGINYLRFTVISTLARIPSVVSSTWAGATLSEGGVLKTVLIFAVTGAIGLIGIYINSRITAKHNENKDKE